MIHKIIFVIEIFYTNKKLLFMFRCVCKKGFIRSEEDQTCICPKYEELKNGTTCKCVSGMIRNKYTGKCVCPKHEELLGTCNYYSY